MSTEKRNGTPDPKSRAHDLFCAILGGFAVFLLATFKMHIDTTAVPYPFYKGPAIFPLIVLSVMALSSLPAFYRLAKPPPDASWNVDNRGWPHRPAIILLMLVLFFPIGIIWIGVEASVFLFLIISYYLLGYRNIRINLLVPLIYTAVIVLIFKHLLNIWFPEPLIFSLIGE